MKNDILLSFVIPVYNVEKYLKECVDSIRNQMTDQCEIILVNDGSTDSSGNICREYSEIDHRIKTFDQKNQGAAVARNTGLTYINGEYVTFVDSDDLIAKDSVGKILSELVSDNCDVYFMQISKLYPDGTVEDLGECLQKDQIQNKTREEVIAHLASRPKFSGSACSKICRKEFLEKNNIRFPEDGLIGEDLIFVRDILLSAEKFDLLEFPYYQYRQSRTGSVTNVVSIKNFRALARFVEQSCAILTENRIPTSDMHKNALSFVSYEYMIEMWQCNFLNKEEKTEAYRWLKTYAWVLSYAQDRKSKIVHMFIAVFGVKLTVKLLKIYTALLKKKN